MQRSAFLAVLAAAATAAAVPALAADAGVPEYFVATVHLDGNTGLTAGAGHPAEAFPQAAMPDGGGLLLSAPDADGKWRMRAFVFAPSQLVVREGDRIGLNFVGVQGPSHRIAVDGVAEVIELRRGEVRRVELVAGKPGRIRFVSLDRQPSMTGEILVLPRV